MCKCKKCKCFKPYGKIMIKMPTWLSQLWFSFKHVRGFCMDSSNPTFNKFAKKNGRGLGWIDYLFTGTEECWLRRKL